MAIAQEISYRLERLILDGGLAPEQKMRRNDNWLPGLVCLGQSSVKPCTNCRGGA